MACWRKGPLVKQEKPDDHAKPDAASRRLLARAAFTVPSERLKERPRTGPAAEAPEAPTSQTVGSVTYLAVKADLHQRLLDEIDRRNLLGAGEEVLVEVVETFVERVLAG